MFDLDQWQEILSTLRRNALRTALTAVGVFWGVLMLMVMVGFGGGLERGVKRDMGGLHTNSIYVWGNKTALPFEGLTPGRYVQLKSSDALELSQAIPEIEAIAPRVTLGGRGGGDLVRAGSKSGTFTISGDVPAYVLAQPETMVYGRFLNALDLEQRRKVAVIGTGVADVLFPGGRDPVGRSIEIKHTEFIVVGVFTTPASGDRGDRMANTIHTPLSTFQQVLRPGPWVHNFAVVVRGDQSTELVERRIKEELARIHKFSPEDQEAVGTWNVEKEFQKINGLFAAISALIWVVGVITLSAGVIGVSNIMMISVRERTREIGVRRALGATPFDIVAQILKESTFLTALAGYAGLVAGVFALELISSLMGTAGPQARSMFDAPRADFGVALAATLAVIAGGALAGLFPALYAVGVRPVVALRDD